MLTIEQLTPDQAHALLPELIELLQDSVASGASIGFLPPLALGEARDYWAGAIAELGRGARRLLVARQAGALVGAVQLALAEKANARHRAEVQKLIVHTRARRQGIGQALMSAADDAARVAGCTLLVLDTRAGDPSEQLYLKQSYTRVGAIPQYARSANGELHATAIFYKLLVPSYTDSGG
jgi:ribosomal protein S18 acetylase RimI-like enzyme